MNALFLVGLLSILSSYADAQVYSAPRNYVLVTSILQEPYLFQSAPGLYGNDRYEGFIKDFAETLFKKLNLQYRLEVVVDGKYGSKDNITQRWNGMIGELVLKRSDMALAPLTVTSARAEVVDFSVPFMQAQSAILLKHDTASDGQESHDGPKEVYPLFALFDPFTFPMWIVSIVALIILVILIYFTEKIVSKKLVIVNSGEIYKESLFAHFGRRVFGPPRSYSARFLQISFWIFSLFLISAYTANFAADKISDYSKNYEIPFISTIGSLADLADQDEVKIGMLDGGSTYESFKKSNDPLIMKLFQKINESEALVDSYEDGIKNVRNSDGTLGFVMESPFAKFTITRKPCNLAMLPELFGPVKDFAVATQKDHFRLNLNMVKINSAVLALHEEGILQSLTEKWFQDQTECSSERLESPKAMSKLNFEKTYGSIRIEEMVILFILLAISVFVVLIIAGIETAINRKSQQSS